VRGIVRQVRRRGGPRVRARYGRRLEDLGGRGGAGGGRKADEQGVRGAPQEVVVDRVDLYVARAGAQQVAERAAAVERGQELSAAGWGCRERGGAAVWMMTGGRCLFGGR